MPPPPILDHIEKTFADQYRKEIDQEENIWRSLPFFAATLALQIAALAQFEARISAVEGGASWLVIGLIVLVVVATTFALLFLALSIRWARFTYISAEPALLHYARALEVAERNAVPGSGTAKAAAIPDEDAATVFKRELTRQYAAATDNNRAVNQRRARHRTSAGMAALASVLATIGILATTVAYHHFKVRGPKLGATQHVVSDRTDPAREGPVTDGTGQGGASPDAGRGERVVQPEGKEDNGRRGGEGQR